MPAPYTGWTFFHTRICCKICNVFEKTKINEKEAGVGPFFIKTSEQVVAVEMTQASELYQCDLQQKIDNKIVEMWRFQQDDQICQTSFCCCTISATTTSTTPTRSFFEK